MSFTAKLATAVSAIAGSIIMTGTAWAFLDLPRPAFQSWTLAQVEKLERNIKQQGEILLDIRRGQIDRSIIELEQKKLKRSPDEEFRLRQFKEDLRRLDTQIDQLKK